MRFVLIAIAFFIIMVDVALAEHPPFTYVTRALDDLVISENAKYIAVVNYSGSEAVSSIVLRRYNPRTRDYVTSNILSGPTLELCSISNVGDISVYNVSSSAYEVYDRAGTFLRSATSNICPANIPSRGSSERDIVKLRALLCTTPADTQMRVGSEYFRVYDFATYLGRLPRGRVLVEATTSPATGDNVIFDRGAYARSLVLVDTTPTRRNYCISSSISTSTPANGCTLSTASGSTALFTHYNLDSNRTAADEPTECLLSIAQVNRTGQPAQATSFAVDWLTGEYTPIEVVSRFFAPVNTQLNVRNFKLKIGEGCGHVIQSYSDNAKLRTRSFGIGDLWCSHY